MNTTAATGVGSLRDTILTAPAGATIQFESMNCPCVFEFDESIVIDKPLTITGMGANLTILTGKTRSHLFKIRSGAVLIEALSLQKSVSLEGTVFHVQDEGTLTISDSQFIGNTVASGIISIEGNLAITASSLWKNKITDENGTLFGATGTLTIANTTIVENIVAGSSGALFKAMNLRIINSTIVENQASRGGIDVGKGRSAVIQNSILVNNKNYDGITANCVIATGGKLSGVTNLEFGAAKSGCIGAGFRVKDPKLSLMAINPPGRGTYTMAIDKTSPAYNTGTLKICLSVPIDKHDQRGVMRPQNRACDIGAFELGNMLLPTPTNTPTKMPSRTPTPTRTPKRTTTLTLTPTPNVSIITTATTPLPAID